MTNKLLSLGLMCGDEHAGEPLKRCLSSVLNYTSGCPVDEIVLGWNGKADEVLLQTLRSLGFDPPAVLRSQKELMRSPWSCFHHPTGTELRVIPFEWPGRFDTARNIWWKYMDAEWLLTMDADDVLADAGRPEDLKAIEAVERDYNLPPPTPGVVAPTLRQWLGTLPPGINLVFTAYDYAVDENGYTAIRQKMKRLVRKAAHHVWFSPDGSGIHEFLTPIGAMPETGIDNLGILMRHAPSQSAAERAKRNTEILSNLSRGDVPIDSRHAYDVCNAQMVQGNIEKAEQAIRIAIQTATNDLDRYQYRLARATLQFQRNLPELAMQEAFAALAVIPDLQEAYYVACQALYAMGKWSGVIEWFERGRSKQPTMLVVDQPLTKFVQPRAQAAVSYLNLGKYQEAFKLAQECAERYPNDFMVKELLDKSGRAVRTQKLHDSLLDVCEMLLDDAPALASEILMGIPRYTVTRGLSRGMRYRTLYQRMKLELEPTSIGPVFERDEFVDAGGLVDLEGALEHADENAFQILEYTQVTPKLAKVKTRRAKRSIAFYSPAAVETWQPRNIDNIGMGGSESSLVYLARELSKRGHPVEVYTPHHSGKDSNVELWGGSHRGEAFSIIEKDYARMREVSNADFIVTCRAPYLARENKDVWGDKPVFCWHQDNGYGNPWLWSKEVIEMQKHLHVSEWAMQGLLHEGYGDIAKGVRPNTEPGRGASIALGHHILGNGVPLECGEGWDKLPRNPHRVIYASDPSRGLEQLLSIWPAVRDAVPDAELYVLGSFKVMVSLKQDAPGLPVLQRVEAIRKAAELMAPMGVKMFGWLPQVSVLTHMKQSSVYCYPGGPMPEGFGVSLAQAAACGCDVIFPDAGALPDVLNPLQPSETINAELLIRRLKNPHEEAIRKMVSKQILAKHGWPAVADRFLSFVEGTR